MGVSREVGYDLVCCDRLRDGVGDGGFCYFRGDEVWITSVEG